MEWDEHEREWEEYPRDAAIDAAKIAVKSFFQDSEHRKSVFYLMQLQVLFEKEFFHWITYKAVDELVEEGQLCDEFRQLGEQKNQMSALFFTLAAGRQNDK